MFPAKEKDLMTASPRCTSHCIAFSFLPLAFGFVLIVASTFSSSACAQDLLAYSFETIQGPGPDGFERNPTAGGTYTQDTIGATHGNFSLKADLIANGDTFVGVYTQLLNPTPHGAIIGDPPGIDHVLFDATVVDQFAGNFADVGVTVFGCDQIGNCGLQRQFISQVSVDRPPGTYTDLRIDLTDSHGAGESFNDAFGESGSGSPLIPTHFQLLINKAFGAPLTIYIDNVRVGMTPPAVEGDYNGNGKVDAADYVLWRDGGPLANEVADPGTVSPADYTEWRARFGNPPAGNSLGSSSVPEPSCGMMLLCAAACRLAVRSRRWT
jgi:hypothetical protein